MRVARFTSTQQQSGSIPNKWGWPDLPQPSSNLAVSPINEGGQVHLNPAAIWQYPQQMRVARFTSTQQLSGSIPNKWGWPDSPQPSSNLAVSPINEGGLVHLNPAAIWQYPQQMRVARFTSTQQQSGSIPNKWGWPDSPQPSSNRAVSPTNEGGQINLNPAAIWQYPQQVRVARFTSTQQQSGSIPNKWGWPGSPQPSSNLAVSPTNDGGQVHLNPAAIWQYPQQMRVARFTSTQQQSGSIPNKWGWPGSPQPSSNLVVSQQMRVARFTSTQQQSGSIPTNEGGQIHLNPAAIWQYLQQMRVARFTSTQQQSGSIPNKWGWPDSPQPSSNLAVSPINEGDQIHLNPAAIGQYPQQMRVARFTSTQQQSGSIPNKWGWPDSPQPSSNLAVSPTNEGGQIHLNPAAIWQHPQQVRVARFTSTQQQSDSIPNKWGWSDSPQPSSNLTASPTSEGGQIHLNPAAIGQYPQQMRVARFTSTQQQSGSIPNKWGWPDSPQPSSNLAVSPTNEGGQIHFYFLYQLWELAFYLQVIFTFLS